ncbi:Uncharacterised protein [Candidatus Bartonella washoeensis]|uniref:Uncharacterized protein n=1 Tax=Candidatus Bartonella washoeensis Sb944nv TaxID=1094563 RepID=J1J2Q0_9HYPH|nr:hypothetical protein [Bartonella washoeensis]EJF77905.1 hypothetical protein MCQ_01348 [Bartonella washoeensis Sb944nv]SPU27566.1 Uncharacterised protein [Bartonella washoeensis]
MKAVITKPMCVVGDNKSTVRFEPSTQTTPFVEISNQVYARLKRANAVKPFVEIKTTAKHDKAVEKVEKAEKEIVQTSTEPVVEEITPEQPKASKASKSSTPTTKKT